MKRIIIILLLIMLVISCRKKVHFQGFNVTPSGLEFKLHNIGELDKKVKEGQIVVMEVQIASLENQVIFTTKNTDSLVIVYYTDEKDAGLMEAVGMLLEGDSATFVAQSANVASYISYDSVRYPEVLMDIHVLRVVDADRWDFEQRYPELLVDYELEEQQLLYRFLNRIDPRQVQKIDGMYFITVEKGTGDLPVTGDEVTLHYEGYLLDGSKFDSTKDAGMPFSYTLGEQDQVLMGFDIGVRQMRKGGKAIFILPSQLAFSDYGSSTGIIPPYTTLIYEVEMLEHIKGEKQVIGEDR